MFLAPENVPLYLAERGLLELKTVVAGDFTVLEQSSRNYNLRVERQHSPGFFIKQVRQPTPDLITSFQREAACYALAQDGKRLAALQRLIPDFHFFDARNHVMVLGLLDEAESLWQHHLREKKFSLEVARLQGEKLGTYHSQVRINDLAPAELEVFPRSLPWILSIHESESPYLARLGGGNAEVVELLRQYPEFPRAMHEIKRTWRRNALIHGDIKWDNLMLWRVAGGWDLKVIDWEMADIGDDCWDVGAIFQSYLTFWIFSLPLQTTALTEAAAESPYVEEEMKQAMRTFWQSYAASRRFSPGKSRRLRERAMRCASARMIQTAFESVQQSPQITPHALCQMQMAMNISRDPGAAVRDLLKVR